MKFADGPEVEVSLLIAAPPSTVWRFVSDINLPSRFQDEFIGAVWLDGDPIGIGSRFLGRNQRGDRNWETTSWLVAYEPDRTFGWAVSDPQNPGAVWTFRLEPAPTGTSLSFHRRLGPGPSGITAIIERNPDKEHEIIAARDATHRANMDAVLKGIRHLAEKAVG